MYEVWTIKHKPKTLAEVVGNKEAKRKLLEWIKSWEKGVPNKRAAFLYGPPGIGKTVTVEALANDLNMELVEKNASDYRTENAIKRFAGLASQYGTLFGRKRLILLDELDGISGQEDRGGLAAITNIVKTAMCPIILIANDPYDPRFSTLRSLCLMIEFKKPSAREIVPLLRRICLKEGIEAEEAALKFIAQRAQGDVRSAINDLQALAQGKKRLTYDDVAWLAYRDRKEQIFNVLRLIFYAKTCSAAKSAMAMADVDPDMLFEWIYENAPYHLKDPHDLAEAMEALAKADIYRGRVRLTQDWKLASYMIDLMTAGVAMARKRTKPSGWIPMKFPQRIKWLSKTRAERQLADAIAQKIKRRCHISAKRAIEEYIPYLKIIFENNPEMAAKIADRLGLDSEMIGYLAGSSANAKKIIELIP